MTELRVIEDIFHVAMFPKEKWEQWWRLSKQSKKYKHMGDAIYSSGIVSTSQHMEKQQSISTYLDFFPVRRKQ